MKKVILLGMVLLGSLMATTSFAQTLKISNESDNKFYEGSIREMYIYNDDKTKQLTLYISTRDQDRGLVSCSITKEQARRILDTDLNGIMSTLSKGNSVTCIYDHDHNISRTENLKDLLLEWIPVDTKNSRR